MWKLYYIFLLIKKYTYIEHFPYWKKSIDKNPHISQIFINECQNRSTYLGIYLSNVSDNKCHHAMSYLTDLNANENSSLNVAGCYYFYYWIYADILNNEIKNTDDIKNIYEGLLNIYIKAFKTFNRTHVCEEYKNTFTNDDVRKLTAIYNIYNSIDVLRDLCGSNREDNFCNEIETIINKYNIIRKYTSKEISETKTLTPCSNNIGVHIIITAVVTLLILIISFTIYKFTTFGTWLRDAIIRKKRHWNNTSDDINLFESSDLSSRNLRNNEYDILYHYS
ncbi:variable surface protein [Plasmodium gonderi]|uniref:Variable surface protein n=1 Tax=Plasmodium gonderi TaxID=77519 RepID=A0A1Y1JXX9_PLAGO|nr:variable surface protein [Plasmodium gonderi]GAW84634.1 variable surface protein [Plasmodium gonderi]